MQRNLNRRRNRNRGGQANEWRACAKHTLLYITVQYGTWRKLPITLNRPTNRAKYLMGKAKVELAAEVSIDQLVNRPASRDT